MNEYTIEKQLDIIVAEKVIKGEYPTPIPLVDTSALLKQISDLREGKVERPSTKAEYINLLKSLEEQISAINAENIEIEKQNNAGRESVDMKYKNDLAAAKINETNIGKALTNCIDYQLNQTLWFVGKDSGLSASQQLIADTWRKNLMEVVFQPTITDAIASYNSIMTTKPDYVIKWNK